MEKFGKLPVCLTMSFAAYIAFFEQGAVAAYASCL